MSDERKLFNFVVLALNATMPTLEDIRNCLRAQRKGLGVRALGNIQRHPICHFLQLGLARVIAKEEVFKDEATLEPPIFIDSIDATIAYIVVAQVFDLNIFRFHNSEPHEYLPSRWRKHHREHSFAIPISPPIWYNIKSDLGELYQPYANVEMANKDLNKAKAAKKDEFYTRLEDIELELKHYRHHFKGKVVLCNCDDPRCSNFFRYFTLNFEVLGLKKVIATCYKSQDVDLFTQGECEKAVYQIYEGDKNNNRKVDNDEIEVKPLKGDGDFRSKECVELLKEADIVVTNPPFSLFREFIALLVKMGKKFLVLGNKNAIKYKEIFPLFMENRLWVGVMPMTREIYFDVPQAYIDEGLRLKKDRTIVKRGDKYMARSPSIWFSNIDHSKRHDEIPLYKKYNPNDYPKYVNYDAIEVAAVSDIPCDYYGVMGVPITFMDKYNPNQFEIVGMSLDLANMSIIREKLGRNDGGPTFYIEKNGKLVRLYDRIAIRRKVEAQ